MPGNPGQSPTPEDRDNTQDEFDRLVIRARRRWQQQEGMVAQPDLEAAIEGGRAAKAEIDGRLEEIERNHALMREAGNQHAVDIGALRSGLDQLYDIGTSLEAELRDQIEKLKAALRETGDTLEARIVALETRENEIFGRLLELEQEPPEREKLIQITYLTVQGKRIHSIVIPSGSQHVTPADVLTDTYRVEVKLLRG